MIVFTFFVVYVYVFVTFVPLNAPNLLLSLSSVRSLDMPLIKKGSCVMILQSIVFESPGTLSLFKIRIFFNKHLSLLNFCLPFPCFIFLMIKQLHGRFIVNLCIKGKGKTQLQGKSLLITCLHLIKVNLPLCIALCDWQNLLTNMDLPILP